MIVSPLLSADRVQQVFNLLQYSDDNDRLFALFHTAPLDENLHLLRFLSFQPEVSGETYDRLIAIWRTLLPSTQREDNPLIRKALWRVSTWWDFEESPATSEENAHLEAHLAQIAGNEKGIDFLKWVVLHPPYRHEIDGIFDEHRRGAITSLARYAYGKQSDTNEIFFARFMDDWLNMQTDVIDILVAMKARILLKIMPWYIEHDTHIRPSLLALF